MKQTTTHSLLIARTLLDRSVDLCNSDDRYLASAGLVLVQDALEIVFYALLIELGVDEAKNLESKSFDELIAELKKAKVPVPKSGTMKALNKQRVLTKHYAQVAEPITVRNYFEIAQHTLDSVVSKVIGKPLYELFLSDFLKDGETKTFLKTAEQLINDEKYLEALIEIRKAIFVEFEKPYSIHMWKDHEEEKSASPLDTYLRGGWNVPYWKRNKQWIEENVSDPTEYVQIDPDEWRVEALEFGIHTVELDNLRRLTPAVFRSDADSPWSVKYDASYEANDATKANAKYCLDRATAIVLKKQEHYNTYRSRGKGSLFDPPSVYIGQRVYKKATTSSEVVHEVTEGYTYEIREFVGGFDPAERFFRILAESEAKDEKDRPKEWLSGYLLIQTEEG